MTTRTNPFTPSAGHPPPYLAGRDPAIREFLRILGTEGPVMTNIILTGLRGLGKTVLLEDLKPKAIASGWFWVGTDLGESASISEESLCTRLLADLALITSPMTVTRTQPRTGFTAGKVTTEVSLDFGELAAMFSAAPGLMSDKLKHVLEFVGERVRETGKQGVIFAYDEAQNLADHAEENQFPLSMLLDVFASLQRKGFPYLLVLTGLPTLYPKLVEARTYAERMFHVITLDKLGAKDSTDAVRKPMVNQPFNFAKETVEHIVSTSDGYPFFIQFISREAYDTLAQRVTGQPVASFGAILRKLDADFFAGRWGRLTDRQRDLLRVISRLETCDGEFTVAEIVEESKKAGGKAFTASHANQMLAALDEKGIVHKTRYGKYCFSVPLFWQFVRRQEPKP